MNVDKININQSEPSYYIAYDIILGFNRVIIGINKRSTKKDVVSADEIAKLFSLNNLDLYPVMDIANSSNCKKLSLRQLAAKLRKQKVQRLSREGVGSSDPKWRAP